LPAFPRPKIRWKEEIPVRDFRARQRAGNPEYCPSGALTFRNGSSRLSLPREMPARPAKLRREICEDESLRQQRAQGLPIQCAWIPQELADWAKWPACSMTHGVAFLLRRNELLRNTD